MKSTKEKIEHLLFELNTLYGMPTKPQRVDKASQTIMGTNEGHYHATSYYGFKLVQYTNSKAGVRTIESFDSKKELMIYISGLLKGYKDAEGFYKDSR